MRYNVVRCGAISRTALSLLVLLHCIALHCLIVYIHTQSHPFPPVHATPRHPNTIGYVPQVRSIECVRSRSRSRSRWFIPFCSNQLNSSRFGSIQFNSTLNEPTVLGTRRIHAMPCHTAIHCKTIHSTKLRLATFVGNLVEFPGCVLQHSLLVVDKDH